MLLYNVSPNTLDTTKCDILFWRGKKNRMGRRGRNRRFANLRPRIRLDTNQDLTQITLLFGEFVTMVNASRFLKCLCSLTWQDLLTWVSKNTSERVKKLCGGWVICMMLNFWWQWKVSGQWFYSIYTVQQLACWSKIPCNYEWFEIPSWMPSTTCVSEKKI